jgi:hypothetical protein
MDRPALRHVVNLFSMAYYLTKLSSILVLLPMVLSYSYLNKESTLAYRILVSIFTIWGISELASSYLALMKQNNHLWLNIQCMISTMMFIAYYCILGNYSKWFNLICLSGFVLFTLIWFVFWGDLHSWSVSYVIVSNMILIFFSAYALLHLINQEQEDLFGMYSFWIHTGVLVYATGSLLFMSFFPLLLNNPDMNFVNNILNVHNVINIISNLLYSIAFICRIKMYKIRLNLQL